MFSSTRRTFSGQSLINKSHIRLCRRGSRCEATNTQTKQNTNCVCPSTKVLCQAVDMKQLPYALLPRLVLEGNLAGRGTASQGLQLSLPRGTLFFCFFFQSELKENRSTDTSTTSSEPKQKGAGSFQWGIDGTTASPGPWEPLLTQQTLWPLSHVMLKVHWEKLRVTSQNYHLSSLSPFFLSLGEGSHTLIPGPTFSLPFVLLSCPLSIQDPCCPPKPKRWLRWNRAARCPPSLASDLCLQVDDVLPHQRDSGAGLLPLHRVQLQRRYGQGLQVFAHPCRGWLRCSPDSLPWPLQRSLLSVLLMSKQAGLEQCSQSATLSNYWLKSAWNRLHYFRGDFLTVTLWIIALWGKHRIRWCLVYINLTLWGCI